MKNEIQRLLNGRRLETQQNNKNLTQNLRQWRKNRNITNENTKVFIENILEELLEICYDNKEEIKDIQNKIYKEHFEFYVSRCNELDVIDAIQDIQVFCINETELMGYDNLKCNVEVFQEINSRQQDPMQYMEWQKNGAIGKWQKDKNQKDWTLYEANYEVCKL